MSADGDIRGLADRVRERMKVLDLNPFSTAQMAGLKPGYVADLLAGRVKNPGADKLAKLAQALDCTLAFLLGQPDEPVRILNHRGDELPPPPLPAEDRFDETIGIQPQLLPVRFELMADTWRPARDVSRPIFGWEAGRPVPAYLTRDTWYELVADDSFAAIAPRGSLVQVVEWKDDDRDQLKHGDIVVIVKRVVTADTKIHLMERSLRRVNYRYPDLGLWFLDYATGDDEMDFSDDSFRDEKGEVAARERAQRRSAMTSEELEADDARAAASMEKIAKSLRDVQLPSEKSGPDIPRRHDWAQLSDAELGEALDRHLETMQAQRPQVVGKAVRCVTALTPDAAFGVLPDWYRDLSQLRG